MISNNYFVGDFLKTNLRVLSWFGHYVGLNKVLIIRSNYDKTCHLNLSYNQWGEKGIQDVWKTHN